jgi:hypothetical protein
VVSLLGVAILMAVARPTGYGAQVPVPHAPDIGAERV